MKLLIISLTLFFTLLVCFFKTSVKFVKKDTVLVIERFGKFNRNVNSNRTVVIPFIEKVKAIVSLEPQKIELPPQSIITTDNVIINIGTVIKFQVTDPVKATYEIESFERGIETMTTKLLHDIVEKMDYDTAINSKTDIRHNIQNILTEAVSSWGITIWEFEFSTFAKNI